MSATITTDLTTITEGTAADSGYWTGTDGESTEVFQQGVSSEGWIVAKNANETGVFDYYTKNGDAAADMSSSDVHLYVHIRCDIAPFIDYLKFRLTDGSANYKEWIMVDNTSIIEWYGEWNTFVLDINKTPDASSGSLVYTDIRTISINVDNSNSGNIRSIENTYIDVIRYGTGITAYGADFNFGDVEIIANSPTNKYGIVEEIDGVYFVQGRITIDDNAGTTTFTSDNETLAFRDREVSSGLYKINFTGTGTTAILNNLILQSAGIEESTRPDFDASGTVGIFSMDGCVFNRVGTVSFKSGQTIENCRFNNCRQISPTTATFGTNIISNYDGTDGGALLFPSDDSNIDYLTFITCGSGVEYASTSDNTSPTFDNFTFDDVSGYYDVNNTSTGTITIINEASNANSYIGNTVNFQSSITLTMTVKDESGTVISGAYAYIDDDDSAPYIMNTNTGSDGIASTAYTGAAAEGSRWRVRLYGYKPYKQLVDIGASDISLPVSLIVDPQQI